MDLPGPKWETLSVMVHRFRFINPLLTTSWSNVKECKKKKKRKMQFAPITGDSGNTNGEAAKASAFKYTKSNFKEQQS